jgi:phage terminase small subunit
MNERQQKFVQEYVVTGNGAESARRAGYARGTANIKAAKLMAHPEIKAAIAEAQAQARRVVGVTLQRITQELANIGFAEVGQPVTLHLKMKALELLSKQVAFESFEARLVAIEEAQARMSRYVPLHEGNGHGVHLRN